MLRIMQMQNTLVVSLILLSLSITCAKQLSWCDAELCSDGKQHIACGHNGQFDPGCPADAEMIDLRAQRSAILHEHNKRRNFIALGQLPGYYPASRMATMTWDDELEYLATLNAKMCYVEHDDCNNSFRYPNVGQNLSGVAFGRVDVNITEVIKKSMSLWFGEYSLIDSSYMSKFRVTSQFEKYGHFAEMVVDRNIRVGCAMVRYTNPLHPNFHIYNTACNYASKYALGLPVYRAGLPASECETGANPLYPGLCSLKEIFNPNYIFSNNYVK